MRLSILGAGAIARQHARAAAALAEAPAQMRVFDPRAKAREAFVKEHPAFQSVAWAEDLLAPGGTAEDLVIVATPPASHVELAVKALRSGRHVLVEKPMALDEAGLRALLETASASGRSFLDCSGRFSHTPAQRWAEAALADGRLGKPKSLRWMHRVRRGRPGVEYQPQSPWFLDRAVAGGGILSDWGPYDLRVLFELLRPVAFEVRSAWQDQFHNGREPQGATYDVETQVVAACALELADGRRVPLSYERASAVHGAGLHLAEIEGERGALSLDWLGWVDAGRVHWSRDVAGEAVDEVLELGPDPVDLQFKPLHGFVRALAEGPEALRAACTQACYVQACVMALARAAVGGAPQRVERQAWELPR